MCRSSQVKSSILLLDYVGSCSSQRAFGKILITTQLYLSRTNLASTLPIKIHRVENFRNMLAWFIYCSLPLWCTLPIAFESKKLECSLRCKRWLVIATFYVIFHALKKCHTFSALCDFSHQIWESHSLRFKWLSDEIWKRWEAFNRYLHGFDFPMCCPQRDMKTWQKNPVSISMCIFSLPSLPLVVSQTGESKDQLTY